jgi:hypothetical protein
MTMRKHIDHFEYVLAKPISGTPSGNTVSYLTMDSKGYVDYTRHVAYARKWKTRKGAQKWLDVREGYGGYTVLELPIWVNDVMDK